MVRIRINTENAAFGEDAGAEVARILRKVAQYMEDWPCTKNFVLGLRDINGNKVGEVRIT